MKSFFRRRRYVLNRPINLIVFSLIFVIGGFSIIMNFSHSSTASNSVEHTQLSQDYDTLIRSIEKVQSQERQKERKVIDETELQDSLLTIQTNERNGHITKARIEIKKLSGRVVAWQKELAKPLAVQKIMSTYSGNNHTFAPILLYHHPPADMEKQFRHLVSHGYTSVSLQQVADAQNGETGLPPKPIVITFDDGFADQMPVLALLKKYNLKAVFYIINGGKGSNFHIGANKKANDPEGGDAYLNWAQIKLLDESGYVEIAAHTTDHIDLAKADPGVQLDEILGGKKYLEDKLGHEVTDFCYPYGAFSQVTIKIVREAGFKTATTTLPGTDQSVASPLTMRRIRDAMILP